MSYPARAEGLVNMIIDKAFTYRTIYIYIYIYYMVVSVTLGFMHFAFVREGEVFFLKKDRLIWLIFVRITGVTCVYVCLSLYILNASTFFLLL